MHVQEARLAVLLFLADARLRLRQSNTCYAGSHKKSPRWKGLAVSRVAAGTAKTTRGIPLDIRSFLLLHARPFDEYVKKEKTR